MKTKFRTITILLIGIFAITFLIIKATYSLIITITGDPEKTEIISKITIHDILTSGEGIYNKEYYLIVDELNITFEEANTLINSPELNNVLTEVLNNVIDYNFNNKSKLSNRYIYNKIVAAVNKDININHELKQKVITKSDEYIEDITNYLYKITVTSNV